MFVNKNKICVWGCGASRQCEIFLFLKIKILLYYFKGLAGAHLDITIIFYYHSQCLKTKIEFVFGGVVLADSPKVFPFLKIKPLFYYFKGLTGAHLDITIVFTITVNVCEQK